MEPTSDAATPPREALDLPNGAIVAALLGAWLGLMALAVSNIAADIDAGLRSAMTLHSGIGPYSGKEAIAWSTWLVSWFVLHVALAKKELDLRRWFGFFLVGTLLAVLLVWPPVFEAIVDAF